MSKRECDIIKDLLPSYVDEICSEASKEWVQEHLKGCEECKKTVAMMKNTEISARRLEQESLDAGRKVIRQNLQRSLLSFGLSVIMLVVLLCSFFWDNGQVPVLLLPICMAMTWLVSRNQMKQRPWDRWDGVAFAIVLVAVCYGAGMMFFTFFRAAGGNTIFGRKFSEIGPVLKSQIVLVAVVCIFVYLWQIVRILKQGRTGSVVLNLCLTGLFLMLSYCAQMGQLSDVDMAWLNLHTVTWMTLAVGVVGTIIFAVIDKTSRK